MAYQRRLSAAAHLLSNKFIAGERSTNDVLPREPASRGVVATLPGKRLQAEGIGIGQIRRCPHCQWRDGLGLVKPDIVIKLVR
jgi:hypothetical protein